MSTINLQELGITKEDLADRVVERVAQEFLGDGDYSYELETRLNKMIVTKINEAVIDLGDREIGPRIEELIKSAVLQATNEWGEARSKPVTFKEYLVERAEKYMTEPVNYEGRARNENRFGDWKATSTRVAYIMDKYLSYHIESAMKTALQDANSYIAKGITEAVRIRLDEIVKSIRATVEVKK
jgi:hypothetical protein